MKKVAGIKIYKTVPDVEGCAADEDPPDRTDRELADPNWPGAAFGRSSYGDSYIRSFLGYEYPAQGPIDALHRGYINTGQRPAASPATAGSKSPTPRTASGRYSARYDEPWQTDKNYLKGYIRFNLDKTPSPSKSPPRLRRHLRGSRHPRRTRPVGGEQHGQGPRISRLTKCWAKTRATPSATSMRPASPCRYVIRFVQKLMQQATRKAHAYS